MDGVVAVLKKFDRLEGNPYFPSQEFLEKVLEKYGYLNLLLFVCPKMQAKYLDTDDRERFMPVEEPRDGLIFPRLPILQKMLAELWKAGVPTKLTFVIGDNGFEVYKGPAIGVILDKQKMDERRKRYLENLESQLIQVFPQLIEVESLGLLNVGVFSGDMAIPADVLEREMDFQRWSFEKYYGGRMPSPEGLKDLATLMIRSYAEEGFLVAADEAILVATEGTDLDSWVRRTQMFMAGGASFSSIYPYIRKEMAEQKEGVNVNNSDSGG